MFLPQRSSNMQEQENDNQFLPNNSQSYHSIVLEHEQRRSLLLAEHSSLPSQGILQVANVSRPSNRQESRQSSQQPALISRNHQWQHEEQEDDGENQFMLDQNSLAEQISKALVKEGSYSGSHLNSKHFQDHKENESHSALWQHSNKGFGLPNKSQNSQDNPFEIKGSNLWKEESHRGLDNFSKSQNSQSKGKLRFGEDSKMMKDHQESQEEEYFNIGNKSNAFESKFDGQQLNMNRFEENSYPIQQQSGESNPFRQQNQSINHIVAELHSNFESNPLKSSFNRQSIQKTQNKRKSSGMERNQSSSSVNQQDTVSKGEIKIEGNSLSQLMLQDRIGESINSSQSKRESLKFRQIESLAQGSSQAILESEVNLYVKAQTNQSLSEQKKQFNVFRESKRESEQNNEGREASNQQSSNIDLEDYNDFVNQILVQDYVIKSSNLELRSNKSALLPSEMEPEQIMESKQSHLERSSSENKQNNSRHISQNELIFQSQQPLSWKNNESNLSERLKMPNQSKEQSNNIKSTSQINKLAQQYLQNESQRSGSIIQQSPNNDSYPIDDKTVENMKPNFAKHSIHYQQQEKSSSRYNYQSHSAGQIRNQSSKVSENNMQNLENSKTNQHLSNKHESEKLSSQYQKSENSNIMNNRSNIFQHQYMGQQSQQRQSLSIQAKNQRQELNWQAGYSKTSEVRDKKEQEGSKSSRNYHNQQSQLSRIQMNSSQIIDQPHFKKQQQQPSLGQNSLIPSQKSNQSSVKESSIKRQTLFQKSKSSSIKESQMNGQKSYLKGNNSQISNVKSQSSKYQIQNKSKVLSQINSSSKKQSSLKDNNSQKPSKDHKDYLLSSGNPLETNSTLFKKKDETKELIFNTFSEEELTASQSQKYNIQHDYISDKKMILSPINETKNQLDKREKILSLRTPESKTKKKTEQKEDQIERIRLFKESQKKRLQRELEKVKKELEQIQIREKQAEKIDRQGEKRISKEEEKLSMHNRHKKQSQAVLKLVKEHKKSREQDQLQFEDIDRNITNNLMQLSRIRQEAQAKNKEKKRLEIMQRMKKNEMRRIQQQKLIKANVQYVQQFRSPDIEGQKEKEIAKEKQKDMGRLKVIAEKQLNMSREKERKVDRQKQRDRNVITEVKITKLKSVGKRRKDDVYQIRLD